MTAFLGSGLQVWTFTHLGNNLYDVTCSARSQCASYLSTPSCGQNFVDVYFQVCHYHTVFKITATTQVRMALSHTSCIQTPLQHAILEQVWLVPLHRLFTNSTLQCISCLVKLAKHAVISDLRDSCFTNFLDFKQEAYCDVWWLHNDVILLTPSGKHSKSLQKASQESCSAILQLSLFRCFSFSLLWEQDDGSGRQRWLVAQVNGGYTMSQPSGRQGCETYLSARACGVSPFMNLATSNASALQVFTISPVNSATGRFLDRPNAL